MNNHVLVYTNAAGKRVARRLSRDAKLAEMVRLYEALGFNPTLVSVNIHEAAPHRKGDGVAQPKKANDV